MHRYSLDLPVLMRIKIAVPECLYLDKPALRHIKLAVPKRFYLDMLVAWYMHTAVPKPLYLDMPALRHIKNAVPKRLYPFKSESAAHDLTSYHLVGGSKLGWACHARWSGAVWSQGYP